MIHVEEAPEPNNFQARVANPGAAALAAAQTAGVNIDFSKHPYWRRILPDLHSAYNGICAYTCHWIAPDTGADTVEHFEPKSLQPNLAYNWTNYRLVCARLNGRKSDFEDVIDPFLLIDGLFRIDFPSLQIAIVHNFGDPPMRRLALETIDRLKLNDNRCIKGRESYVQPYCRGEITLEYISRMAPFLSREITRQGLENKLPEMMAY